MALVVGVALVGPGPRRSEDVVDALGGFVAGREARAEGTQGPAGAARPQAPQGPLAEREPLAERKPAAERGPRATLGPVAYRVVRLEALRFGIAADATPAVPDLGADGRWEPVGREAPSDAAPRAADAISSAADAGSGAADAGSCAADAVLLEDLRAADGPPAPPPAGGADPRERGTSWWLVATWEASALVRVEADGAPPSPHGPRSPADGSRGAPTVRVARARRAVATPLPPPDLARARPGADPPWPAFWCGAPPPHPDPAVGAIRRPAPARRADDVAAAGGASDAAFGRAVARARAGDPVGAWAALAADAAGDAGRPDPARGAADAVLRRAWAAEIALAAGRPSEAARAFGAAAALAAAATPRAGGPDDGASVGLDVAAYLRTRAAVATWRVDAAGRGAALAAARRAGAGAVRRGGAGAGTRGPRGAAADDAVDGPLDARGDATLRWPPSSSPRDGAGLATGDGALSAARRRTAAWWRARR